MLFQNMPCYVFFLELIFTTIPRKRGGEMDKGEKARKGKASDIVEQIKACLKEHPFSCYEHIDNLLGLSYQPLEETLRAFANSDKEADEYILVRKHCCSGKTDTANLMAGNRCSGTGIPLLFDYLVCQFTRLRLDLTHILPAWICN